MSLDVHEIDKLREQLKSDKVTQRKVNRVPRMRLGEACAYSVLSTLTDMICVAVLSQEGVKHCNKILDSSDVLVALDLKTSALRPQDKIPGASAEAFPTALKAAYDTSEAVPYLRL